MCRLWTANVGDGGDDLPSQPLPVDDVVRGDVVRVLDFLDEETFLRHFQAKGRFREFNAAIPLAIVLAEQPGLRGCARALKLAI